MAVVCKKIITGEQDAYKKILPEGSRRGGGVSENSISKLVGIYIDSHNESGCYLFYSSNSFSNHMYFRRNKNETPNMEVSSYMDMHYGVTCGVSFSISLNRRAIGG